MSKTDLISKEKIERVIHIIRGEKVMLDRDLAELYQVQTKHLIKPYAAITIGFPQTLCFNFQRKKLSS